MSVRFKLSLGALCSLAVAAATGCEDADDRPPPVVPPPGATDVEGVDEATPPPPPSAPASTKITYDHEAKVAKEREALQRLVDAETQAGRPIIESSGIPLSFAGALDQKPDPLAAMSGCSAWVLGCHGHEIKTRGLAPGDNSDAVFDACMNAVPTCQTDKPWLEDGTCCAAQCRALYQSGVKRGLPRFKAFQSALFEAKCMPGVAARLEGAPPR